MLYRCHEGVMEISPPLPGFLIRASYFSWTCHLLFFGNDLHKSQNSTMSVFCSNTLIFARVPKIHSKRSRFQHFCHGPCPQTPLVTCTFSTCKLPLWCKFFFSFSAYSKAFATYSKPYWQPSFQTFCQGACPRTPLVTYTYTFGACKLRLWCKFFFLHCLLQSFCHLLKTLMTTWHVLFNTSFLCLMPVLLAVCTFPTFFCFQNQRWILKGFSRSLSY